MSKQERRLGVSEVNLVTRKLKLEPCNEEALGLAIGEIDEVYGVDRVDYDTDKRRLSLAYDASRLCIDHIEAILDRHAIEISNDWWTRFKEDHYRFVDQNIKDNASKEPWSCH
ncbi:MULTISPECIES: cation transporter [unclassified Halomonas]|uniref:cation transporter n=1 Tax=unclassified Halomonas TaxID=2609666 RepID=UPI0024685246|nr:MULTISPECIES: cation transporter [unclassified Halomonas]